MPNLAMIVRRYPQTACISQNTLVPFSGLHQEPEVYIEMKENVSGVCVDTSIFMHQQTVTLGTLVSLPVKSVSASWPLRMHKKQVIMQYGRGGPLARNNIFRGNKYDTINLKRNQPISVNYAHENFAIQDVREHVSLPRTS